VASDFFVGYLKVTTKPVSCNAVRTRCAQQTGPEVEGQPGTWRRPRGHSGGLADARMQLAHQVRVAREGGTGMAVGAGEGGC